MNLSKAFVFVLLAFLLIGAVSAVDDTSLSADTVTTGQQSLYESTMQTTLDYETVMTNALNCETNIGNALNCKTDINNALNSEIDIDNASYTEKNTDNSLDNEKDTVSALKTENNNVVSDVESRDHINISFSEQMYEKELEDIDVELGDDISGELCIKIDEEIIYNETITDSHFKVPIVLPKKNYELVINIWPGIDCRTYAVHAFLNGEDLKLNKTLKIMKLPQDYSYLHFQEEVLTSNDRQIFVFPRSANGIVEIWLDDVLLNKTKAQPIIYFDKLNLTLGNHSWKVLFYNDSYYNDLNAIANFSAVNVKINIPKIVNITHDDCISVETIYNGGTVKTYIDGRLADTSKVVDKYFVLCLEQYLKKDSQEVKVVYENGKIKREKTQSISIVYDFDLLSSEYFTYGEDNLIEIILPDTLNNKLLTVEINGTKYAFKRPAYAGNNIIEINISKLQAGNYSMHISYAGDDRFEAKDEIINFTVNYNIIAPDYIEYKDSSFVYLNLPNDARGNLIVHMDGKLFGNVTLKNGFAKIKVDTLAPGFHSMNVGYSGDDYEVAAYEDLIHAAGRMTISYSFTAGENKYVVYDMPESSGGYVVFTINGKEHKVNVKNGKARYSLKNLKAGDYEISIDYYRNGEYISGDYAEIEIKKSKIKIISYKMSSKSIKVKIKLSKPMKTTVYVKFMGKKYKIKTNSKGVGTFKKSLKIKKSKKSIKFSHLGSTLTKKLYKPNLKVKKSNKKLTLKTIVNIKSAKIRFKVGKKTYTVKTNSKGIAKISVKKPKARSVLCKAIYYGCKVSKNVRL